LPEVFVEGRGVSLASELSTTQFLPTTTMVVEKPALVSEIEKLQIVEEVQPVVYKETVVPTVIQETKPVYQKIVEGPVYSQTTLPAMRANVERVQAEAYRTSTEVVAPVLEQVMLPAQIIERPVAVHEEIRKEIVEEIQPVLNVEKLKTEIHQVTQPLFDKEVRAVNIEKKVLATEILPEVFIEGRGASLAADISTTKYLASEAVVVEKPAMFVEVEKTQVIEEIQPVLYKETIVPRVIQETKPVYQKIVEGPVYTQQTLAPRSLAETHYKYPTTYTSGAVNLGPSHLGTSNLGSSNLGSSFNNDLSKKF